MIARIRIILAFILTVFLLFTARLMYLQFIRGEQFQQLSENNFLEERRIPPLRGRILARDGTVLADNRIVVDLMYWGGDIEHWERISYMLGIDEDPIAPDPEDSRERAQGRVLMWGVDDSLIPALNELIAGQRSLYLRQRIERRYLHSFAAHVVGHTTEADPQRFPGHELGDLVGLRGIEAGFQEKLFGTPGARIVGLNNRRSVISSRETEAPQPGQDIVLTIDPRLQEAAERTLANALVYVNRDRRNKGLPLEEHVSGAIVAIDPRNGEILALASYPSYDPNIFTRRPSSPEDISRVLSDYARLPMMNRAVEAYPPASTFKLVSSWALLEDGFIAPNSRYLCSASFDFLGIRMRNWAGYTRGNYNVLEAIADSCNTFYWRAAAATPNANVGWAPFVRGLTERAQSLGFGARLDIGLLEEKPGLVPTDDYSREVRGFPWRPGDTLNLSIGQGDMLATPLQVTYLAAIIAMNGYAAQPHLVRSIGDEPLGTTSREVPGRFWGTVRDGMRMMMTHYGARSTLGPNVFPVATAGKTGTAQNAQGTGYEHAWFMGYGPLDNPELAVTVFIENGGSSTAVAIPVARDFMAEFWGHYQFVQRP